MTFFYCWPHFSYHLLNSFPKNNRFKVRTVILLMSILLMVPLLLVLFLPNTMNRYCEQPLFELLIASIIFLMFTMSFTLLFIIMDPVPWQVKALFHVFGIFSLVLTIVHIIYFFTGFYCKTYTPGLFYVSMGIVVFDIIGAVWFVFTVPFWIANRAKYNSVLDPKIRSGICYEPVKCCPCVWHV
ncbi:uncharacterized protein LOC141909316 [Tubulanus polymorphus]|uniref:uncharacterized protein LOC141909316 n=1 Tax=Tubulanus polymorphus TaxID=672921 RepID=UPI003DA33379